MMINRKTTLRWALFALCLILVSSFVSAEWTKGTSNLVSYWTFDDANTIGSIAIGFNNTGNGTISGAFTGATGIIAEAYDFERGDLNDRVESSSTPYAFGTDDFSISLWYKPQTVSGGEIYTLFYSNDAGAGDRFIFYVTDDGTVIFFTYDGTATTAQTTEVLSAGNWYHLVGVRNGTSLKVYINATEKASTTGTTRNLNDVGGTAYVGRWKTTAHQANGNIDEVFISGDVWDTNDIEFLYNLGAPGTDQQPPFADVPSIDNFSITAVSNWTGGNLSNFSAEINGFIYNTTNGTLITDILSNSSGLFNVTVFSDVRFNRTYFNFNVSGDLEANLRQTQVNISFEFSSGDLVTLPLNLSALDIGEDYNVSVGYQVLFPDAGFVNFSALSNIGVFDSFNFTLNLSALDNSSFVFVVNETHNVITFLDENTSNPIENATVIVTSPNGIILNLSTNASGQINFSYVLNNSLDFGNYSYFFDKVGYVNITLFDIINESNIPHTRTYNLSRAKLNIFIYDRVTRTLLNGTNVFVAFIGLFNETTDTGILIKDNLTIVGGDYIIFASAEGYKTSIRTLTFTNQEEFTLEFYLLNLSVSNAGTLFVSTKDSFFRDITGAKVDLLEYIPGSLSFVSVDSCVSNVNAECSFAVELNTKVYYIRATNIIGDTVFVAETSRNGEIFTVNNDIRNLIFFTTSTFSISTSTNLIYDIDETFINNVSTISVDFFTSDGTAKEVCVEYFILDGGSWVSVTGDTYCLVSSNAIQNIDVDVTLNRSNTYQARIYVKESFDNILKTYDYPNSSSASEIFDNDFKAIIIMIFWVFALAFSLHQKNITLFFFLAIIISWAEVLLFPLFSIVIISVFKTIICLFSMYISRRRQDFQ